METDLIKASLAQNGSLIITDQAIHEHSSIGLIFLTDTVLGDGNECNIEGIDDIEASGGNTITFSKGDVLMGKFQKVQLSSGACQALTGFVR